MLSRRISFCATTEKLFSLSDLSYFICPGRKLVSGVSCPVDCRLSRQSCVPEILSLRSAALAQEPTCSECTVDLELSVREVSPASRLFFCFFFSAAVLSLKRGFGDVDESRRMFVLLYLDVR